MIEWVVIGIVGFIVAILFLSSSTRNRGSRDHVRMHRTAEKAERQREREKDFVREKERSHYGDGF